MPFSVKSAQELFQKSINRLLGDLPGVKTDIDDILVRGRSKEHDQQLKAVLKHCKEIHLTLNRNKCNFGVSKVSYIGHILNEKGVQPDPDKIKTICDMPAPQNKKGLERLLGTVRKLPCKVYTQHVNYHKTNQRCPQSRCNVSLGNRTKQSP